MLRTIRIYGRLAKFLKRRKFEAEVGSAAEAVRFLVTNFPQLERHMADQHYKVSVGNYALTMDELHHPSGQQEIRIIPVLAGAGGGVGNILAGVALIALSLGTAWMAAGAVWAGTLAWGTAQTIGTIATLGVGIGASMILGGVAQLLTPVPKLPNGSTDPQSSYNFSGIQNSSRQGLPVPICYGEVLVGSIVISAGIDTVQVTS